MRNREYGSDFHYNSEEKWNLEANIPSVFDAIDFSFFFSGRAVLYALLEQGINNKGWGKVYFPSFYCHEVVEFVRNLNIEILYYPFNPFLDSEEMQLDIEDSPLNVIVNVNYFGLKKINLNHYTQSIILEDVTHSILDYKNSKATYCFGSLRKELPVPVGGFCYSPKKLALPQPIANFECDAIAVQKLTAMYLKKIYLEGTFKDKEVYRNLFIEAENEFGTLFSKSAMPKIAKTILFGFDSNAIIESKKDNVKIAISLLNETTKLKVNFGLNLQGFGLVLELFSEEEKNDLKNTLIDKSIFPATLWPNQKLSRDQLVENKTLFIHLDYRYSSSDVVYIINCIKNHFRHD